MNTQIITRSVLSQALSWANAPRILHAAYSRQTVESSRQTVCQQVWLTFDRPELHIWVSKTDHFLTAPRTTAIVAALQDCFCADVQIICAHYMPFTALIKVSALLIVSQGD